MGISSYRKNKVELIQAIQRTENNIPCFGTSRVDHCNEPACSWRADCVSLTQVAKREKRNAV